MLAIDLRKQQAFDANPKSIQIILLQIWINLERKTFMLFIYEQVKEIILDFSPGFPRIL